MIEDWQQGGFGIYVHWPFCQAKCPYCDFNSHVRTGIDQQRWRDAYHQALTFAAERVPGRPVSSIFFGGGTPSLMDPEVVGRVIEDVRSHWPTSNDLEISLEANPTSVEGAKFAAFKDAGINRISMGIQALNDDDLKRLGRMHSADEALKAFDIARSLFERVSFDLIYARQNQTVDSWRAELKQALDLGLDHLSLYQLTIEPNTRFGELFERNKLPGLPSSDLGADLHDATQDLCENAGLHAYEVSNYARSGAECRHNLVYWSYGDYLGIGPGAHGRITVNGERFATETTLSPEGWLSQVEGNPHDAWSQTQLSRDDQATEFLLMGLRVNTGISLSRFEALKGAPIDAGKVSDLKSMGFLEQNGDHLVATKTGRMILNTVLSELLNP